MATRGYWLINRNFALLWGGQSLSNIGDAFFDTTLLIAVADVARDQIWAPLAVSGLLVAEIAPMFLVRPLVGVLVDRWSAQPTLLWVDGLRAALVGLLWLLIGVFGGATSNGHGGTSWHLGVVYAAVLALSVAGQFFGPAQVVLLTAIVAPPQRVRASGLSMLTSDFATIGGTALAGPLYFSGGLQWALAINAGSFCCSLLALGLMRPPPLVLPRVQQPTHFLREFHTRMRLFFRQPTLRTVGIALAIAMFGVGALQSLNVFFVTRNLHAPVAFYGFLGAAFGVGSLVGGALGALLAKRLGPASVFGGAMVAVGGIIVLYAHATSAIPALALYGLLGIPNALNNIVSAPLVLSVTPSVYVGRVFALLTPIWSAAYFLSILLSGYLYSTVLRQFTFTCWGITVGPLDTLLTITGLLVILGGIYALWQFHAASHRNARNGDDA